MLNVRTVVLFALIYGIAFAVFGVGGFVPGLTTMVAGDPNLSVTQPGHGYLLGLFHVNVLHNLVHLLFGIWGIVASRGGYDASRLYFRAVAIIYAVFVICGLVPGLEYMFGLVPLHGNDVWLHIVLAGVAAYFGFAPTETTRRKSTVAA